MMYQQGVEHDTSEEAVDELRTRVLDMAEKLRDHGYVSISEALCGAVEEFDDLLSTASHFTTVFLDPETFRRTRHIAVNHLASRMQLAQIGVIMNFPDAVSKGGNP